MSDLHEPEVVDAGTGGASRAEESARASTWPGGGAGRRWRFDDAVAAARHLSTRSG